MQSAVQKDFLEIEQTFLQTAKGEREEKQCEVIISSRADSDRLYLKIFVCFPFFFLFFFYKITVSLISFDCVTTSR